MDTFNIAIIGTGYIGGEHIKAIAAHTTAQLHTICSTPRSENIARDLMETYKAGKVTTDYTQVLQDPDVDLLYLCTPNSQHCSQAVAALEAGKHIFVEKPLAVTVSECQQIVDKVSEETGLFDYLLLYSTREIKKTRVKYLV